jgi:hypothetical protein
MVHLAIKGQIRIISALQLRGGMRAQLCDLLVVKAVEMLIVQRIGDEVSSAEHCPGDNSDQLVRPARLREKQREARAAYENGGQRSLAGERESE